MQKEVKQSNSATGMGTTIKKANEDKRTRYSEDGGGGEMRGFEANIKVNQCADVKIK